MQDKLKKCIFLILFLITKQIIFSQNYYTPYIKIGNLNTTLAEAVEKIKKKLNSKSCEILGEFKPSSNENLYVIIFTHKLFIEIASKADNAGLLAAIQKIAIINENNELKIILLNPEYILTAFIQNNISDTDRRLYLQKIDEIKYTLKMNVPLFEYFGGKIEETKLKTYTYKPNMPDFQKKIMVKQFNSYQEGVNIINSNLEGRKLKNSKVFELKIDSKEIAIFGICMYHEQKGEKSYISLIESERISCLPYELILIGKQAFFLNRAYRFALFYPDIQQNVFSQLMSATRGVDEMMEIITKK